MNLLMKSYFNGNDRKQLIKIYGNLKELVEKGQELRTESDAHKKELNAVIKEDALRKQVTNPKHF